MDILTCMLRAQGCVDKAGLGKFVKLNALGKRVKQPSIKA